MSPIWLLLGCGLGHGYLPQRKIAEEEIRVSVAALQHTLAQMREAGEISATSRLVLAFEQFHSTPATASEDSQVVEVVARSVGVFVAPLGEVLICPDTCRLDADFVFQFGSRQIEGDTAYVWVYSRRYNANFRDPTPMAGHELILRRGEEGWTVIGSRGIMRS